MFVYMIFNPFSSVLSYSLHAEKGLKKNGGRPAVSLYKDVRIHKHSNCGNLGKLTYMCEYSYHFPRDDPLAPVPPLPHHFDRSLQPKLTPFVPRRGPFDGFVLLREPFPTRLPWWTSSPRRGCELFADIN